MKYNVHHVTYQCKMKPRSPPDTIYGLLAQELTLIDEYGSFVYNTSGLQYMVRFG